MDMPAPPEITYLGHSTFTMRSTDGICILLDPWLKNNPSCPAEYKSAEMLGKIDVLLITHMHSDHTEDMQDVILCNPGIVIFCIAEIAQIAAAMGASNIQPMNKGGTVAKEGLSVTMTEAIHSSSSFTEVNGENTMVYGGEPAGFLIKFSNGFTLYCAGDTGLFGDMLLLKDLYQPHMAILPIGDRFTMGPLQAAHAVKLLGVHSVIPCHFGTFPLLSGTPDAFQQELEKLDLASVQVHTLLPGKKLSL